MLRRNYGITEIGNYGKPIGRNYGLTELRKQASLDLQKYGEAQRAELRIYGKTELRKQASLDIRKYGEAQRAELRIYGKNGITEASFAGSTEIRMYAA